MKAVGYKAPSPIMHPDSLVDIDLPTPVARGRDLLVEVRAVSVNPVDVKLRASAAPLDGDTFRVLGFDASGVVREAGPQATLFKPGDEVWYAGSIMRSGTNAELHVVDERIVAAKPRSLTFAHAAALPLTAITAWELLFDRLCVRFGKPSDAGSLLIIGGAGGVGSILTQLARRLTGLTIISTSSRPETRAWCLELGAHFVIDHTQPFAPQLRKIGISDVNFIAALTASDRHFPSMVEVLAPQGRIGMIDDPATVDVKLLKPKSASLHWEFMFTRSKFGTPDMIAQHLLLTEVSRLVDDGIIRTTAETEVGHIDAATLKRAHAMLESGRTRGKVVLAGFK
jgi:NADPH2:quinone reductase